MTLVEPWAEELRRAGVALAPLNVATIDAYSGSYMVRSNRPVGKVTIELLGHHRQVIAKSSANVGAAWTAIRVPRKEQKEDEYEYAEVVRIRAGEASEELAAGFGDFNETLGGAKAIDWEVINKVRESMTKSAAPPGGSGTTSAP